MKADHDHVAEQSTPGWVREAVDGAGSNGADDPDITTELGPEQRVLERIERARRRKPKVREKRVTLAHGAGGKATQTLIEAIFVERFRNPVLERLDDAATLDVAGSRLAFTTDSFVVSPLFFPGGDIGDLAINGTVNDLAVSGAEPLYLSAGFIIEEGFPVADLTRVVDSMARAAEAAGVSVVTGDTKVVEKGKADGCYINTAGVGIRQTEHQLGIAHAKPGDAVVVSGPIGDHGVTVMLARGELDIDANLVSDTAAVHHMVADVLADVPGVRTIRDATRGGVATVLNEVAKAAEVCVVVNEAALPVRTEVRGASELLGIDPLYVACEGRIVLVVDSGEVDNTLQKLQRHSLGTQAAVVGHVKDDPSGMVLLNTTFGGSRIVDLLVGDPLPRIC